jgi:hypothetical protein
MQGAALTEDVSARTRRRAVRRYRHDAARGASREERNLIGERAGTRTQDLLIKSQLLYRLSYALVTKA